VKFTVLSHAGLAVDHGGVRLVFDPWLIGSCYWRSWWNYPEPDPALVQNLAPQFIYLTHLHSDHFHGPSLKKLFDPTTTVLVPKAPTRRMVDDLRWLGFPNIIEISHGKKFRLADDFEMHSYQFGLGIDSAAVISGGGYTLLNCNDCKSFGLPLRQILRNHRKIDFIFRSHSSASPIPLCIEDHEKLLAQDDGSYDSADQFARCAIYIGARYAIPFASNHCFLHPETRHFNSTVTTPELAKSRYRAIAAEVGVKTECVVMPPSSSWSDTEGFKISPFDFSQREAHIAKLLERNGSKLAVQCALEAKAVGDFPGFEKYFRQFCRSLPWLIRGRRLPALTFRVRDCEGVHHWLVDPRLGEVTSVAAPPPNALIVEVHAAVLNDCANSRMFSVWTASKRLKIHLPSAEALGAATLWFNLLDLYEIGLLPIINNFSLRSLAVRLRRWREPVEVANLLLRRIFLRQRFSVSRIYPVEELSPRQRKVARSDALAGEAAAVFLARRDHPRSQGAVAHERQKPGTSRVHGLRFDQHGSALTGDSSHRLQVTGEHRACNDLSFEDGHPKTLVSRRK
jgi:UDP-MurNAc hydroxylase